jgi:hypothetical protein
MNERDTKFFRPLWLRIGLTAAIAAWFLFEALYSHDQFWMLITAAAFAYCIWSFFISYPKGVPTPGDQPPSEPPKQS